MLVVWPLWCCGCLLSFCVVVFGGSVLVVGDWVVVFAGCIMFFWWLFYSLKWLACRFGGCVSQLEL